MTDISQAAPDPAQPTQRTGLIFKGPAGEINGLMLALLVAILAIAAPQDAHFAKLLIGIFVAVRIGTVVLALFPDLLNRIAHPRRAAETAPKAQTYLSERVQVLPLGLLILPRRAALGLWLLLEGLGLSLVIALALSEGSRQQDAAWILLPFTWYVFVQAVVVALITLWAYLSDSETARRKAARARRSGTPPEVQRGARRTLVLGLLGLIAGFALVPAALPVYADQSTLKTVIAAVATILVYLASSLTALLSQSPTPAPNAAQDTVQGPEPEAAPVSRWPSGTTLRTVIVVLLTLGASLWQLVNPGMTGTQLYIVQGLLILAGLVAILNAGRGFDAKLARAPAEPEDSNAPPPEAATQSGQLAPIFEGPTETVIAELLPLVIAIMAIAAPVKSTGMWIMVGAVVATRFLAILLSMFPGWTKLFGSQPAEMSQKIHEAQDAQVRLIPGSATSCSRATANRLWLAIEAIGFGVLILAPSLTGHAGNATSIKASFTGYLFAVTLWQTLWGLWDYVAKAQANAATRASATQDTGVANWVLLLPQTLGLLALFAMLVTTWPGGNATDMALLAAITTVVMQGLAFPKLFTDAKTARRQATARAALVFLMALVVPVMQIFDPAASDVTANIVVQSLLISIGVLKIYDACKATYASFLPAAPATETGEATQAETQADTLAETQAPTQPPVWRIFKGPAGDISALTLTFIIAFRLIAQPTDAIFAMILLGVFAALRIATVAAALVPGWLAARKAAQDDSGTKSFMDAQTYLAEEVQILPFGLLACTRWWALVGWLALEVLGSGVMIAVAAQHMKDAATILTAFDWYAFGVTVVAALILTWVFLDSAEKKRIKARRAEGLRAPTADGETPPPNLRQWDLAQTLFTYLLMLAMVPTTLPVPPLSTLAPKMASVITLVALAYKAFELVRKTQAAQAQPDTAPPNWHPVLRAALALVLGAAACFPAFIPDLPNFWNQLTTQSLILVAGGLTLFDARRDFTKKLSRDPADADPDALTDDDRKADTDDYKIFKGPAGAMNTQMLGAVVAISTLAFPKDATAIWIFAGLFAAIRLLSVLGPLIRSVIAAWGKDDQRHARYNSYMAEHVSMLPWGFGLVTRTTSTWIWFAAELALLGGLLAAMGIITAHRPAGREDIQFATDLSQPFLWYIFVATVFQAMVALRDYGFSRWKESFGKDAPTRTDAQKEVDTVKVTLGAMTLTCTLMMLFAAFPLSPPMWAKALAAGFAIFAQVIALIELTELKLVEEDQSTGTIMRSLLAIGLTIAYSILGLISNMDTWVQALTLIATALAMIDARKAFKGVLARNDSKNQAEALLESESWFSTKRRSAKQVVHRNLPDYRNWQALGTEYRIFKGPAGEVNTIVLALAVAINELATPTTSSGAVIFASVFLGLRVLSALAATAPGFLMKGSRERAPDERYVDYKTETVSILPGGLGCMPRFKAIWLWVALEIAATVTVALVMWHLMAGAPPAQEPTPETAAAAAAQARTFLQPLAWYVFVAAVYQAITAARVYSMEALANNPAPAPSDPQRVRNLHSFNFALKSLNLLTSGLMLLAAWPPVSTTWGPALAAGFVLFGQLLKMLELRLGYSEGAEWVAVRGVLVLLLTLAFTVIGIVPVSGTGWFATHKTWIVQGLTLIAAVPMLLNGHYAFKDVLAKRAAPTAAPAPATVLATVPVSAATEDAQRASAAIQIFKDKRHRTDLSTQPEAQ